MNKSLASPQSPAAIEVKDCSKVFVKAHVRTIKSSFVNAGVMLTGGHKKNKADEFPAIKDVSFQVKPGEFFGIVGRNGSGKSTMLKMLAGIYQPTGGRIAVNGSLVPFIELGVGFNPELTGRDNVYLNGALLGFSRQAVDDMYDDIVEFAELKDFMEEKLKNFSSGMQVRLAFSMAIRAKADIMLIDEVLAVGDLDFQRKCYEYFKQVKHDKQTVVFVSHDMAAVRQYCDRALLLEGGRIKKIGDVDQVATAYSKLFLADSRQTDSKKQVSPSGEERWGDKKARWKSIKVTFEKADKQLEPGHFLIVAKGRATQDLEYPIFGFSVKDADFKHLIGTNTVRRNIKLPSVRKNKDFSVTWKVPNIFNAGRYYVDITIAHDQASQVSDRWPDATTLEITRLEDNPYPMYGNINFAFNDTGD